MHHLGDRFNPLHPCHVACVSNSHLLPDKVLSFFHSIPHSWQQRTGEWSLRFLILGKFLTSFPRAAWSLVSTAPRDVNYTPAHWTLLLKDTDVGLTAGQPQTQLPARNHNIHLTPFPHLTLLFCN